MLKKKKLTSPDKQITEQSTGKTGVDEVKPTAQEDSEHQEEKIAKEETPNYNFSPKTQYERPYTTPVRDKPGAWVQAENTRAVRKDIPSNQDGPTFNEEGECNHIDWIDWVNQTVLEFEIPDKLVTSKLSIVLTGLA